MSVGVNDCLRSRLQSTSVRTVTNLRKDESHRGEAGQRADVVFADFTPAVVDDGEDLREDDGEPVVDTGRKAGIPGCGLEADVLEEVQW